ncbi:MAG: molybdopterin-guanine dinucleotide biosynthesis protein B [Pseudomonadota bacterium]
MHNAPHDLFGVTGWKDSGKTTLVVKLLEEFIRRGITVSTVKHAHDGFEVDREGTDSARHRAAGAYETALVSNTRFALMHQQQAGGASPTLDQIISKLAPCQLVLVEGFKSHPLPKIECVRAESANRDPVWTTNKTVIAVATDQPDANCPLPQFALDDVADIADYIAQKIGLQTVR